MGLSGIMAVNAQHGTWLPDDKCLVSVIFVVVIIILWKWKGTIYFRIVSENITKKILTGGY